MVTTRPPFGTSRTRHPAGPLHVLWLAALLFGFLYTHAAAPDSATAHVTGGATASVHHAAPDSATTHSDGLTPEGSEDGEEHSHPAEACTTGQPHQDVALPAPALTPLSWLTSDRVATTRAPLAAAVAPSALPSVRSSLSSVVQQV
ncbi:hypothetical protein [Streptomyces sp. H34-S4]|uniref:hypothetical protein n=1 Tax=Streptomyces sp. H34-S4 TaxID=2996463 RepID=UPI00226E8FC8|nr:hypothetical protein [Streptomyces sp. H34-S4]MCY0937496.1 hypothetical protein [Streptomyces sp. H34-S4]